jgi:hypothetical protein
MPSGKKKVNKNQCISSTVTSNNMEKRKCRNSRDIPLEEKVAKKPCTEENNSKVGKRIVSPEKPGMFEDSKAVALKYEFAVFLTFNQMSNASQTKSKPMGMSRKLLSWQPSPNVLTNQACWRRIQCKPLNH